MDRQQYVKKGFITLLSILIVGVVGLSISITLILVSLGISRNAGASLDSERAKAYANACVEEGLQQINDSTNFTGSGNISFKNGTCAYSVNNLGGQNREVNASGASQNAVRRVKVLINNVNPSINVTSWKEVADF